MVTIAIVIIAIASVIGISLFLTQSGWLNPNTPNSTPDIGTLGPINTTPTLNQGTAITTNGTQTVNSNGTQTVNSNGTQTVNSNGTQTVNSNGTQTVIEKQVVYSNVSAIIGIETKTLEANITKRLGQNATHWITGTITLNEEVMDENDDKYMNIQISGWHKFNHGSSWITICETWVGTSPMGERIIIDLREPDGMEALEDSDDSDCDFINPYSKLKVDLDNERSSYEKSVTLDLFVFSSNVVSTGNEG